MNRLLRTAFVLAFILAFVAMTSNVFALTIAVDSTTRYQTITGFGTCSYLYDGNVSTDYTTTAFKNMYAQDLGASMMRMEIGPDIQPTEDLDLNNLNTNLLDFTANSTVINGPLMQAINSLKLDQFKVVASVWTPPAWMKDNGSLYNGGHLRADRRDHFGKYLAAFCTKFQQTYGVPVYAVSLQNELEFAQQFYSCQYTQAELTATIKAVKAQFVKWGITTKIMSPEDLGGVQYWIEREMSYVYNFQNDPIAGPEVDLFNIHGYADAATNSSGGTPSSGQDFHNRIQGYNKEMWQTETSGEDIAWLHNNATSGVQDGAETVASHIHSILVDGYGNAWLYWQVVDAAKNTFSLTDVTNDTTAPKYCAAKHYFRYIRPGAVRVAASGSNATFLTSAYVQDANKTLTVVLQNLDTASLPVTVTLPSFPAITTMQVWRTSSTESFAAQTNLTASGGQVTLTLPAQSLVTLYGVGTGTAPTVPTAPTNLVPVSGDRVVNLSWSSSPGATSYAVKRGTATGGPYTTIVPSQTGTAYKDTAVINGSSYYYVVTATNASGTSPNSVQAAGLPITANATYTTTPPVIDGTVDPVWSTAATYSINNITVPGITDSSDLSGTFQELWDANNLYVLVNVTDQTVTTGDYVEIYTDADNSKSPSFAQDSNDFQYRFKWNATTIEGTGNPAGVVFATGAMTGGYRIEVKFPLSSLGIAPSAGNVYGFDVNLGDQDVVGTDKGKKAWYATVDNDWMFPGAFGAGQLLTAAGLPTPPATPTGLIVGSVGNSQINLSWNASTGATGYAVKRSTTSGGPYTLLTTVSTTAYSDLGLNDGVYYYVVSAFNLGGQSAFSAQVSGSPSTPTPPTGTVQINCGGVGILTWLADTAYVTGGGNAYNASGPVDRRITDPAPEYVYLATRDGNSTYTVGGLVANGGYLVRLHFCEGYVNTVGGRTFNVSINGTQVLTNFDILATAGAMNKAVIQQFGGTADGTGTIAIVLTTVVNNATISGIEIIPSFAQPPPVPQNVTGTPGNGQAALNWSVSTGATTYNVLRSTVSGSGYASVATGIGPNAYTNTSLTNGTTYYYVIQAVNGAGPSANSSQVAATPQPPAPGAPTGLTAAAGNTQVALSWTASSGATSYSALRSTVSGSGYASVATGIATTSYTNTGLTNGTTYYFVVQAVNGGGASGNSNQASATPQFPIPPTPTGLTASPGNALVALWWSASTGATSYSVKRSTVSGSGYASVATGISVINYTNTGLTNGTAYYFVVTATDAAGTSGNSAQASAAPVAGSGTGLKGEYYNTTDLTGPVVLSRTDAAVNFDWADSPGAGVNADFFTVRWSGQVQAPVTGNYTFSTTSDDGVRLWVNGVLVINDWNLHGITVDNSPLIALTAGTKYDIHMEYFENTGGAIAKLHWSYPGQADQAIPPSKLFPAEQQAAIATATTAPVIDGTVDASWGNAASYNLGLIPFGIISSGADLTAMFRAMWDTTNLYLLVDVTDDVKVNDSASVFDDDCVEVFIDGNNSKGATYDGANDIQYGFGWGDSAVVEGAGPAGRTTGITFAKVDVFSTTYRMEIKIPWTTIGVTPAANALVGLDVHVDDDDDGGVRDGMKAWWDSANIARTSPSAFGTGKLK